VRETKVRETKVLATNLLATNLLPTNIRNVLATPFGLSRGARINSRQNFGGAWLLGGLGSWKIWARRSRLSGDLGSREI
jgi:hypothetical protein